MGKQVIISIGREFGSGGHVIAEQLAKRFDIPLYDNNILCNIAEEKEVDYVSWEKYDEKPKNKLLYRKVSGHSNSPEENIANLQFEYIQRLAGSGQSFVIVGRCAETKLREFPGLVTVFVLARKEFKIKRVMDKFGLSEDAAKLRMKREDWKHKSYHNYYCKMKWGDSRNYDLCVDSGKLGIEGTVDFLEDYIKRRMEQ